MYALPPAPPPQWGFGRCELNGFLCYNSYISCLCIGAEAQVCALLSQCCILPTASRRCVSVIPLRKGIGNPAAGTLLIFNHLFLLHMKKTIITLLALAGVAMADGTLLWELDIQKTGITLSENSSSQVQLGSISTDGITLNDGSFTTSTTNSLTLNLSNAGGLQMQHGFSVAFKANLLSYDSGNEWPIMFAVGEASDYNYFFWASTPKAGWGEDDKYGFDCTGAWSLKDENDKVIGGTPGGDVELNVERSYVITMDTSDVTKPVLTLYVDGVEAATRVFGSQQGNKQAVDYLCFGSSTAGETRKYEATFSQVQMYSGVLSQSQITALVPEPATATLSLLALAGLAARRRRK